MSDGDRDARVTANEPQANNDTPGASAPAGEGRPHGTVASPAEAVARENALDEETAGDGVAFFEGGDGREEARADMERDG